MLLNDYINKLDYDEEILVNEACDELDTKFNELPIFCESADEYYVFSEGVASSFIAWVQKIVEAVKKFFADVFGNIAAAFEKKDVKENLAKFKKLSGEDQKKCLKALKDKKLTQLDVDRFEKAVQAVQSELEKAYSKYETMKFKDSAARDAYVDNALDTAMKKLKALDDQMDAKLAKAVDEKVIDEAESGSKGIAKKFDAMISSITDSMEKIGKTESTDSDKDVDKTSGRKSFVLAFKNLGRTVRTGFAKHGKAVIAVATALGVITLGVAAHATGLDKKALDAIKGAGSKPLYLPKDSQRAANKAAEENILNASNGGKTTNISDESEENGGIVNSIKTAVRNYSTKRSAKKNLGNDVTDVYFVK